MSILTTARIEWAVQTYEFWLEWYGVPPARRRLQRRELRANLADATADVGLERALTGVGNLRALALADGEPNARRPRWYAGLLAAVLVLGLLLYAYLFTITAYTDGVVASGVTDTDVTSHSVFPWYGLEFTTRVSETGLMTGGTFPWPILVIALVMFLLAARAWRAVARRSE